MPPLARHGEIEGISEDLPCCRRVVILPHLEIRVRGRQRLMEPHVWIRVRFTPGPDLEFGIHRVRFAVAELERFPRQCQFADEPHAGVKLLMHRPLSEIHWHDEGDGVRQIGGVIEERYRQFPAFAKRRVADDGSLIRCSLYAHVSISAHISRRSL